VNLSSNQGGNAYQGNYLQNRRSSNNNGRNRGGYSGHNGHYKSSQGHNSYNDFFNNRRGGDKFNGAPRPDGFVNCNQGQGPAMAMGLQNMHYLPGAPVYGNYLPSQPMPPMQLNPGAAPYMMSPPKMMNQLPVPGPYNMMPPDVPHPPVVGGYSNSPQMTRPLPARPAHGFPLPANQGVPIPVTPRHDTVALDSYQSADKFADSMTNSASKTVPNTPNVPLLSYQFSTTLSPNATAAVNHGGLHYRSLHRVQPPHTAMPSFGTPYRVPSDLNTNLKSNTASNVTSTRPKNIDTPLANTQPQHDRNICAIATVSNHDRMLIKGSIEVLHFDADLKRTLCENERALALNNYAEAAMKEEQYDTMMLRYHEQIIKYLIRHVTAVLPEGASDEQRKEYEDEKKLQMQKATNAMHHAFQNQIAGSKFRKDAEFHRAMVVQCERDLMKVETELNKETWKLIQKALNGVEDDIDSVKNKLETLASVKHGNGSQKGNGPQNGNRSKNSRDGDTRKMSTTSHTADNGHGKTKNGNPFERGKPYLNDGNRGHSSDSEVKGDGALNNKGQNRNWRSNHKKSISVTTDNSKTTHTSKTESKAEPKTVPKTKPKIEPTPAEAARMGNEMASTGTANFSADSVQNDNSNGSQSDNVQFSKPESTNSSQNETSSGKKDNIPNYHNRNYKNKNKKNKKNVTAHTDTSRMDAALRNSSPELDIAKLERPKTAAPKAETKVGDASGKKLIDPNSYARRV
jgi:hypothetical protein